MQIILASTSPYRKRLLQRLAFDFRCMPPQVDETPLAGEPPQQMAQRLATDKAVAIAQQHSDAIVIGSDQVASLHGIALGKPGTRDKAAAQLRASSGHQVNFFTAITIARNGGRKLLTHIEHFSVHFRSLSDADIDRYLALEPALDCAGSFKWEGLGIALFEKLEGDDPTSLEGLPLIALCRLLRQTGVNIPPAQPFPDSALKSSS